MSGFCTSLAAARLNILVDWSTLRGRLRQKSRRAMLQKSQSLWEKRNIQNLFRYQPSGTYFARQTCRRLTDGERSGRLALPGQLAAERRRQKIHREMIVCVSPDPDDTVRLLDYSV